MTFEQFQRLMDESMKYLQEVQQTLASGDPKVKEEVLKDVTLGPKTKVANFLDFAGYTYDKNVIFS